MKFEIKCTLDVASIYNAFRLVWICLVHYLNYECFTALKGTHFYTLVVWLSVLIILHPVKANVKGGGSLKLELTERRSNVNKNPYNNFSILVL